MSDLPQRAASASSADSSAAAAPAPQPRKRFLLQQAIAGVVAAVLRSGFLGPALVIFVLNQLLQRWVGLYSQAFYVPPEVRATCNILVPLSGAIAFNIAGTLAKHVIGARLKSLIAAAVLAALSLCAFGYHYYLEIRFTLAPDAALVAAGESSTSTTSEPSTKRGRWERGRVFLNPPQLPQRLLDRMAIEEAELPSRTYSRLAFVSADPDTWDDLLREDAPLDIWRLTCLFILAHIASVATLAAAIACAKEAPESSLVDVLIKLIAELLGTRSEAAVTPASIASAATPAALLQQKPAKAQKKAGRGAR